MHVVLRHATLASNDDAALDQRGAAMRLIDDEGAVLDLPMNTGTSNTFQNAYVPLDLLRLGPLGALGLRKFARKHSRVWAETTKAYRIGPSSFSLMHYYAQLVFPFTAEDGVPRYIRYRILPEHDGEESGLPKPEFLEHPFRVRRASDDKRPPDYLRAEFRERLNRGTVTYRLQAQLHVVGDDDAAEIRDTSRACDQDQPWLNLGSIVLD